MPQNETVDQSQPAAVFPAGSNTPVAPKLRVFGRQHLDQIPQIQSLSADAIWAMKAVSAVLPFRVSNYVLEQLIDWSNVPEDPIFQLTFPQQGMLEDVDFQRLFALVRRNAPDCEVESLAREIQLTLNPHPSGQMQLNVPRLNQEPLPGMQHKYRETVLFFPAPGQTCFSYCTYCFRWAQFVDLEGLKFASNEASKLVAYLREHKEVQSLLITGGDPLVMRTELLRKYIEPVLSPELSHVTSIRIGTKALAYWPYRFTTDADADDLLRLFEDVVAAGKHLAIMAHYSHPRQLETDAARHAVRRVQASGAVIRGQAPCIRHVNDDASTWERMWLLEVQQGIVPYYMFVERDTGARRYFEVPLSRVLDIFQAAYSRVSGLARTVRGPSMSATPGKVLVDGVAEVAGERVFVLKMLQGRDPAWVNKVFFAKFDDVATWLDGLTPAFGAGEFFFEPALRRMMSSGEAQVWHDRKNSERRSTLPTIRSPSSNCA